MYCRGILYQEQGRYSEAIQSYKLAIQCRPRLTSMNTATITYFLSAINFIKPVFNDYAILAEWFSYSRQISVARCVSFGWKTTVRKSCRCFFLLVSCSLNVAWLIQATAHASRVTILNRKSLFSVCLCLWCSVAYLNLGIVYAMVGMKSEAENVSFIGRLLR